MLNRLLSRQSPLRILTLISPKSLNLKPPPLSFSNANPSSTFFYFSNPRHLSSNRRNNNGGNGSDTSDFWRLSAETENTVDSIFGDEDDGLEGISGDGDEKPKYDVFEGISVGRDEKPGYDVFKGIDVGTEVRESEEKAWSLDGDKVDDVFGFGEEERVEAVEEDRGEEREEIRKKREEDEKRQLEEEEKVLSAVLKGPNRAFGDLITASGITDEMLDSLMALKDLGGIQGLPPLSEIEDMRYEKNTRKSSRADIERQKQEEVAKARVRQVDDKGRAYGTGRRKCSVARVWIQPGEGKFVVNDKEFDVYFPMLDHRAALLRPFSETKTLGLWDVSCTVKGGGVSGQVGAVQLGISRALQNWEPNLRPPLRAVGFLTRDPRVVERKKPGKAKARKSFQWVKR